jgi:hypothetical protein
MQPSEVFFGRSDFLKKKTASIKRFGDSVFDENSKVVCDYCDCIILNGFIARTNFGRLCSCINCMDQFFEVKRKPCV